MTPERLAVQGDVVPPVGVTVGQPRPDDPVEVVGIQGSQDQGQGGGRRNPPAPKSEGVPEPVLTEPTELGDGGQTRVPGEDSDHAQSQDRDQRVAKTPRIPRVL
nr:hypothetical protein [Fimbriiglobus ruber]